MKKLKPEKLTVDKIMSWSPCPSWTRTKVERYFKKKKTVDILWVLEHPAISIEDKHWVFNRIYMLKYTNFMKHLTLIIAENLLKTHKEAGCSITWTAYELLLHYRNYVEEHPTLPKYKLDQMRKRIRIEINTHGSSTRFPRKNLVLETILAAVYPQVFPEYYTVCRWSCYCFPKFQADPLPRTFKEQKKHTQRLIRKEFKKFLNGELPRSIYRSIPQIKNRRKKS